MTDNTPENEPMSFEELDKLADEGELTPETLQQKLNEYAEAFRQEFEETSKSDPANVQEYTRDFFAKNMHAAAAQIVWLANNSASESVRFNASKYVIEAAAADADKAGDPIKAMLEKLGANG